MSVLPAGFFESDQLGRGSCLHHMLTGKTDIDVVFGEKYKTKKFVQLFVLYFSPKTTNFLGVEMKNAKDSTVLLLE